MDRNTHNLYNNPTGDQMFVSLFAPLFSGKSSSHLESLVSRDMLTELIPGTCGGGTWHMLHGQGIPVPIPQCWKLLPRGPAPGGAFRSPW